MYTLKNIGVAFEDIYDVINTVTYEKNELYDRGPKPDDFVKIIFDSKMIDRTSSVAASILDEIDNEDKKKEKAQQKKKDKNDRKKLKRVAKKKGISIDELIE